MHFDLELILVLGSLLTGLVWLADVLWLRRQRLAAAPAAEGAAGGAGTAAAAGTMPEPWWVEYSRSFFPVLFVVLVLRSFIAEPFRIPSGSMMPTLLVGDFILVNKFSYGLRLPVLHTKVLDLGEPKRGDVVVFRYPRDPSMDYIKRIIGLPGDRVAYFKKQLTINGKPVPQRLLGPYTGGGPYADANQLLLEEDLPEVKHDILINPIRPTVEGEYVVPPGHYFVMGDNRDNSNDSRYWGFVPEENLVGKAMFIWMNWDFAHGAFDFSRIGRGIH